MSALVQALAPTNSDKRWSAIITYRYENGPRPIYHHFDEIGELEPLIERGPDWNCILDVTLVLNRRHHTLTVEEASRK